LIWLAADSNQKLIYWKIIAVKLVLLQPTKKTSRIFIVIQNFQLNLLLPDLALWLLKRKAEAI